MIEHPVTRKASLLVSSRLLSPVQNRWKQAAFLCFHSCLGSRVPLAAGRQGKPPCASFQCRNPVVVRVVGPEKALMVPCGCPQKIGMVARGAHRRMVAIRKFHQLILPDRIALVVSVVLAVWAWQYFQFCQMVGGKTLVLKLPMMCSRFALVLGYTLPVVYNIYHFILSVCDLIDLHRGKTITSEGGND